MTFFHQTMCDLEMRLMNPLGARCVVLTHPCLDFLASSKTLSLWTVNNNQHYSYNLCVVSFQLFPFMEAHKTVNNEKTEQHNKQMLLLLSREMLTGSPSPLPHCALGSASQHGLRKSRHWSGRLYFTRKNSVVIGRRRRSRTEHPVSYRYDYLCIVKSKESGRRPLMW